jgi:hypothetical protein
MAENKPSEQDVTVKANAGADYEARPYHEAISKEHRAFLANEYPGQLPPTPAAEKKAAEREPERVEDK